MCGAKLVLPGPGVSGDKLYAHMRDEGCTFSLGVPTVWLGFFNYIETNKDKLDLKQIKLARVVVGGSAAPRAIVEKFHDLFGAYLIHAWGMTETSPLATIGNLLPAHDALPLASRFDIQAKQGRAIFGVEVDIFSLTASACRMTAPPLVKSRSAAPGWCPPTTATSPAPQRMRTAGSALVTSRR